MNPTIAEVFLAYRHAKNALYQEQRGVGRLYHARAHETVPALLGKIRDDICENRWFPPVSIGSVWPVPKSARVTILDKLVPRIGEDNNARTTQVEVRLQLLPTIEFAIHEIMWVWAFGAAFEVLLLPGVRANRLMLSRGRRAIDTGTRGPFTFWPRQYERFRDEGLIAAERILTSEPGRCVLAVLDIKSYYDRIDPRFLTSSRFVDQLSTNAAIRNVPFNAVMYRKATSALLRAYGRYQQKAAQLTGRTVKRGIPVGAITSRIVGNLALARCDALISSNQLVRYYARYVDDILLVADGAEPGRTQPADILSRLLPLAPKSRAGVLRLDQTRLERRGSSFELVPSKVKVYSLSGPQGKAFLETIRRDLQTITSERRSFLPPEDPRVISKLEAFLVSEDGQRRVRVLRDADRLKTERFAASILVSKAAEAVELLGRYPATAVWCRERLGLLAGLVTDAEHWIEFMETWLRILSVAIRAEDKETIQLVLSRCEVRMRETLGPQGGELVWSGQPITNERAKRRVRNWLRVRIVEEICASARVQGGLIGSGILKVGTKVLSAAFFERYARALRRVDLRLLDREADVQGDAVTAEKWEPEWQALEAQVEREALLEGRLTRIREFLRVCEAIGDKVYQGFTPLQMLLSTRPPTAFDVSARWMKSDRPVADLVSTINALRGTSYDETAVEEREGGAVLVRDLDGLWFEEVNRTRVVLCNIPAETSWLKKSAMGSPETTPARLNALSVAVNAMIRERQRHGPRTIGVLPELSLPEAWLRRVAKRCVAEDVGFVAGLDYVRSRQWVVNQAVGVIPCGRNLAFVCRWVKRFPAEVERKELGALVPPTGFDPTLPYRPPTVVGCRYGDISVLICSELLEVVPRAALLGRVDVLFVPCWNQDTATFDPIVRTVAIDLHCYVAVANNGKYSDCRVEGPMQERWARVVGRLISREWRALGVTLEVGRLRSHQRGWPGSVSSEFMPLPPGYSYRRIT